MVDQPDPALIAALQEKLADVLDRKSRNERLRADLAAEGLAIDRDLADLRAAARVLGVRLPFPAPPDDDKALWLSNVLYQNVVRQTVRPRNVATSPDPPTPVSGAGSASTPPPRPPIKDIVLDRLKAAGAAGSRAAPIRAHIERVYNEHIHEKTVGMTLYRLAKDGFVRRDGRTWFLVPHHGAGNPGAGTPGLLESL